MLADIASSLVSAGALVLVAVLTFVLNEAAKRRAAWRDKKLEYYADFFDSLATNIEGYATSESHAEFARQTNNMNLIASAEVLLALHAYREQISSSNTNRSYELDEGCLRNLLCAMRRDLKMPGGDELPDGSVRLWAPGPRMPKTNQPR